MPAVYAETILHDFYVSATKIQEQIKFEEEIEAVHQLADGFYRQAVLNQTVVNVITPSENKVSVGILDRSFVDSLLFTQTIGAGRIYAETINDSFALANIISSPINLTQALSLGEVIVGEASHFFPQSITLTQTISTTSSVFTREWSESITVAQYITGGVIDSGEATRAGFSKKVVPVSGSPNPI